jgi:16S rRNA (guanine527-N7)-methyltransferase
VGLFLKGREALSEIADAKMRWTFDVMTHPSISDVEGRIVEIRKPKLIRHGGQ